MQQSAPPPGAFSILLKPLEILVEPFRFIYRNRLLIWSFSRRGFEVNTRGSLLGNVWMFFNPLLMLSLYYLVFGYIFRGSFGLRPNETSIDYALGIFLSLTLFHTVSDTLGAAPFLIVNNQSFVKRVVFPLEMIPVSAVGSAMVSEVASLSLFALAYWLGGDFHTWRICLLPLLVLPMMAFALGATWMLSALGVFMRDLGQVMPVVAIVLMYTSAVFYSTAKLPALAWNILKFNPILHGIECARILVLSDASPPWGRLLFMYASCFFMFYFGYYLFMRLKPVFADVI